MGWPDHRLRSTGEGRQLAKGAHGWPGRGAGAGDVVVAYLRAERDELLARDPQVRLDVDGAVHRMRVVTRRLRSGLATFGPLFAAPLLHGPVVERATTSLDEVYRKAHAQAERGRSRDFGYGGSRVVRVPGGLVPGG